MTTIKTRLHQIRKTSLLICSLYLIVVSFFSSCTQDQQTVKTTKLPSDGSVLPFPEPTSASVTGKTLAESSHKWRETPRRLPEDAPNIVIFMTDDAGFGNPSTFGGPINTPTMSRLAESGISYNAFHTTAMCSPTRAALLTGRNHHRVGAGQIAELASDWDGYVGLIPKSTSTFAQVISYYGYNTAAFGKWHNTPITDPTSGVAGRPRLTERPTTTSSATPESGPRWSSVSAGSTPYGLRPAASTGHAYSD